MTENEISAWAMIDAIVLGWIGLLSLVGAATLLYGLFRAVI
jgi:hypothetical protein